ncbi:hypothetical protein OHS70_37525 [Streptomyces sp. NBC_00390]
MTEIILASSTVDWGAGIGNPAALQRHWDRLLLPLGCTLANG